jgi:hypothetical protein
LSIADNDPEDFLHLWQQTYGLLDEEMREDFLFNSVAEEICCYHIDLIQDAILKNNSKLKDILLYVQSHPHIPREEKEGTYFAVDVGAYYFEGRIFSVRRDRKSENLQAWEFDNVKQEYKRPFFSSEERRILSTLNSRFRLSLKLAQKHSIESGICCHCGRLLTAKRSVANGMGPICKSYYH